VDSTITPRRVSSSSNSPPAHWRSHEPDEVRLTKALDPFLTDQPLFLEGMQRLAHGRARDGVVLAQERFGMQPITMRPLTGLNLVLQELAQLKMERD